MSKILNEEWEEVENIVSIVFRALGKRQKRNSKRGHKIWNEKLPK